MTKLLKLAFFGCAALTVASVVGGLFVQLSTGFSAAYFSMVALSGIFGGLSGYYWNKWQVVSYTESCRAAHEAARQDFAFWNAKPVEGVVVA